MVARSPQQNDLVELINTTFLKRKRCMFLASCAKFLGWLCEH